MVLVPSLKELEGRWSIARIIKDRRAGVEGKLTGEAVFTPQDDGAMIYEESGTLSYGNQSSMEATRRYIWRDGENGIDVQFDDGRPFHTIDRHRSMPDANHHCDPDLYHVSYDFTAFPQWQSIWRVVGPAKDYRMVTLFTRAP